MVPRLLLRSGGFKGSRILLGPSTLNIGLISQGPTSKVNALAEIDYNFLGKELEGAPDHPDNLEEGQKVTYPVKVLNQPHWCQSLGRTIKFGPG